MQLIYDNIVASMVGAAVILVMVFTNHQTQIAASEAAGFYIMQQQLIDFTSTLQRDMQNVSSVVDTEMADSTFSFFAQVSPSDTTKMQVIYLRKTVGSRYVDGANVPLYQIERYVNGAIAGGGIASVTEWSIEVLNGEGNSIIDPANARQVAINFRVVPPIDVEVIEGITVGDTRWETTFHPTMLRDSSL
ncbi:MAG: hypothetical protein HKN43_08720 [Rhodothermales bacterium]|nr:hypothetical protein [Rhodothermales bacterium]